MSFSEIWHLFSRALIRNFLWWYYHRSLITVDSLLTDTSIRRTPLWNGHLKLVPAFLYSFYLTLYKTDTSLRRTLSAVPKDVRLRESWLYIYSPWKKLKKKRMRFYLNYSGTRKVKTTQFPDGLRLNFIVWIFIIPLEMMYLTTSLWPCRAA